MSIINTTYCNIQIVATAQKRPFIGATEVIIADLLVHLGIITYLCTLFQGNTK